MDRILQSFQRSLDLRDKYMKVSRQRLGDNPRDHDGHFAGLPEGTAGVAAMRPDVDTGMELPKEQAYEPWKIYPRPPAPHWQWTDQDDGEKVPAGLNTPPGPEEFEFNKCEILGEQDWTFELDERGVYQVYGEQTGTFAPLFCLIIVDSVSRRQKAFV